MPDSEDLTMDDKKNIFVVSERDGNNSKMNRISVLQYIDDTASSSNATALVASQEWDFTADFPNTVNNFAFEGIAFVLDSHLVAVGFIDKNTNKPYKPSLYADHGNGIFFIGYEGDLYVEFFFFFSISLLVFFCSLFCYFIIFCFVWKRWFRFTTIIHSFIRSCSGHIFSLRKWQHLCVCFAA